MSKCDLFEEMQRRKKELQDFENETNRRRSVLEAIRRKQRAAIRAGKKPQLRCIKSS